MSDEELSIDITAAEPPPVKTIDQWAAAKGLGPQSWEMAAVRAFFNSIIGKETTEAEFDEALHHARFASHGA